MALFGFSDITFSKGVSERTGPLADLVSNEFKTTTLRYPLDVGNADKAHYIVIYIRRQKASTATTDKLELSGGDAAFEKSRESLQAGAQQQIRGALSSATSSVQNMSKNFGSEILGKINSGLNQINTSTNGALSGITSAISGAAGGAVASLNNLFAKTSVSMTGSQQETTAFIDASIKKITGGSSGLLRTTRLTTDAIALYMPDTLNYDYEQSFDDPGVGKSTIGQAVVAGKAGFDSYKDGGSGTAVAKGAVDTAVTKSGQKVAEYLAGRNNKTAGGAAFSAISGKVSNPMLELIYTSPNFRTFDFAFTFYPRDEREALEAQRIIERLRFHQAPELSDFNLLLIPPSEFDIKFYYAGAENPNIPPIAESCVLQKMQVNYAPNGFSAYEVPGENKPALGRTGMPVAIQLTLSFKETTFLTKADFKNDSGEQTLAKSPDSDINGFV